MKKGIIYLVANSLTGQKYVGATTNDLESRIEDHFLKSNNNTGYKFHEAISTYGTDAFTWEQIDTAQTIDELAKKEKEYILKYNSKEDGYNSDEGGGFKKTVYQYGILEGNLISKYTDLSQAANSINSTKQAISRACLSVNKTYSGYYWSYEYIEPFKPERDARRKKVIQLSMDSEILAEYVSAAEASRLTGLSKSCITKVCRGERNHSGGFKWKYV